MKNPLSNTNTNEPNFFQKVYQVTKLIPYGRVTSYGAIARYLGTAQSSRMVGWALNCSNNIIDEWVPAHRVVNRVGMLSGKHHFPGSDTMKQLLESEGVRIEADRVVEFEKLFWDPNKELS